MKREAQPSPTYRLFAWANDNRVPLVCLHRGRPKAICPVIVGHTDGKEVALAWQYAGKTSGRLPDWRCLYFALVGDAQPVEGEWQAGPSHQSRQTCVQIVDYDANEHSPYNPTRSLGDLRGLPVPALDGPA